MEDLLLKEIPVAAAVIITVGLFLRHQKQMSKDWNATVNRLSDQLMKSHAACTKAIVDNTKVLERVGGVIERHIEQIEGGR